MNLRSPISDTSTTCSFETTSQYHQPGTNASGSPGIDYPSKTPVSGFGGSTSKSAEKQNASTLISFYPCSCPCPSSAKSRWSPSPTMPFPAPMPTGIRRENESFSTNSLRWPVRNQKPLLPLASSRKGNWLKPTRFLRARSLLLPMASATTSIFSPKKSSNKSI